MIVQKAPDQAPADAPRFVIKNTEHTALAGELAASFGNEAFAPLAPAEDMLFLVRHHDQGWEAVDTDPAIDPATGLPYNLIETPLDIILATSNASPEFNLRERGPLVGLLSSMHIYGLYTGRYGMSDKVPLDNIPAAVRPKVDAMLERERERQARLRAELADDPLAAEGPLMHNYKLLQFFDTLALYFNMAPEGERGESAFSNVPRGIDDDVTVTVREQAPGEYAFSPFPFRASGVQVTCRGRYLQPGEGDHFATTPATEQHYRLVAG